MQQHQFQSWFPYGPTTISKQQFQNWLPLQSFATAFICSSANQKISGSKFKSDKKFLTKPIGWNTSITPDDWNSCIDNVHDTRIGRPQQKCWNQCQSLFLNHDKGSVFRSIISEMYDAIPLLGLSKCMGGSYVSPWFAWAGILTKIIEKAVTWITKYLKEYD